LAPPRSYRSKIEVLRDFLSAAREPVPKTRLIGLANLNPPAFQRYLRICTDRGLIEKVSGAYVATPRAMPLLEAIDGLILKTAELERSFQALEGTTETPRIRNGGTGNDVSPFLMRAWSEILLRPVVPSNGHRSGACAAPPSASVDGPAPPSRAEHPMTLRWSRVSGRANEGPGRTV
jgi:predicted transcriptional regulator